MKILKKDLTTISSGVILHQVNCQGRFASGLAGCIRQKFPEVYLSYMNYFQTYGKNNLLGKFDDVHVSDFLVIVNCFSQEFYGYDGRRYTDYDAVRKIFRNVYKKFGENEYFAPYLYGCGLGNGDWNIVSEIILEQIPSITFCEI